MDEAAQRERRSPSGPCLSTRCAAQANQTLTSDVHTSMSWCGVLEQLAVGDHRHPADARSEDTLEGSRNGNTGRDDSVGDGGGAVRNCARMPPASCAAEALLLPSLPSLPSLLPSPRFRLVALLADSLLLQQKTPGHARLGIRRQRLILLVPFT